MQDTGADDSPFSEARCEIGQCAVFENIDHFVGDAWQSDDHAVPNLQQEAGRGAYSVLKGLGSVRQESLAPIVFTRSTPKTGKALLDLFPQLVLEFQIKLQGARDSFAGHIVYGGTQASGAQQDLRSAHGMAHRLGDARLIVAHGGSVKQVNTGVPQLAG